MIKTLKIRPHFQAGAAATVSRRPSARELLTSTALVLLSLLPPVAARAQQPEGLLTYGITGSERGTYSAAMSHVEVQRLLLDIAAAPRRPDFVDDALKGTGVTREGLEALGLVRREGDAYVISFFLLTKDDETKVRAVTEAHARSLAAALLARRAEIETALRQYQMPGVDQRAVAYVLLGCFSLDWDGLDLTAEKGYRSGAKVRANGEQYIPWARQNGGLTLKGLYWGSHNDCGPDVVFTSFGDHHALPRTALPDLFWRLPKTPSGETDDALRAMLAPVVARSHEATLREMGRMMLALRDGERSAAELAQAAGVTQDEASSDLALLEELGYVGRRNGNYHTLIPVLTERDGPMVRKLLRIGREAMAGWLAADYARLKDELTDVTPIRYGVAYGEVFTQVWHYVFAAANRQLVEAGLFADPYDAGRKYKGFIPAVWQPGINKLR